MARKKTYGRRPNNAGTVVKLSGKRRKPYCARISSDERDIMTGKKKQIIIGTFETKLEALNALSLYHMTVQKTLSDKEADAIDANLYNQIMQRKNAHVPTFAQLYDNVDRNYISKLSSSAKRGYAASFKRINKLHDRPITELSLKKIQSVFDELKRTTTKDSLSDSKRIVKMVFKEAIIQELISKEDDLTEYINIDTDFEGTKTVHRSFNINEISKLIEDDTYESKVILIYIFTGCRAIELLNLPKENIHIKEICNDDGVEREVSYIIAGVKTTSGKNRIIPIHKVIEPYIIEMLKKDNVLLRYPQKSPYDAFKIQLFLPLMKRLKMNHLPHDTRHTFSTLAEMYNLNEYMVKKILGHKYQDLTKDVYTHTLVNRLYTEIHKIQL